MSGMIKFVEEEQIISTLKEVKDITESCIGPNGRFKVLQTNSGGYAMMTTTSSKVFDFFSSTSSACQILLSGLKSHLQLYSNGGLFLVSLSSNLFLAHCQSGVPRNICVTANSYVLQKIKKKIEFGGFVQKVDLGNLKEMNVLVKSILASKPVCQVSAEEIKHLSLSILKAFFTSAVSNRSRPIEEGLTIVTHEGPNVINTHVISGFLLHLPSLDVIGESLLATINGCFKIIVFATSLAGDQSIFDDTVKLTNKSNFVIDQFTYKQLFKIGDAVAESGVQLLCCQKIVHPSIRRYLEKKGILVVDRIGHQMARKLCAAVQIQPIESVFNDVAEFNIGKCDKIEFYEFFGKRYLVLQPGIGNEVNTMVLCSRDENTLDELRSTIQSVEKTLFHIIDDGRVCCGAGCFEAQIAAFVREMERENFTEEDAVNFEGIANFHRVHWKTAFESIASSFARVARSLHKDNGDCYIDTSFNHLWCFPTNVEPETIINVHYSCCCGSISYHPGLKFESLLLEKTGSEDTNGSAIPNTGIGKIVSGSPEIIDSFFLRRECIASAFELCNVILRVGMSLEKQ